MTQLIKLIFEIIEGIFKFVFELCEFLYKLIFRTRKKVYNAEFASQGSLLSSRSKGFCLTGKRNLTVKQSYQNALILGGTGTGKTSVTLLPSLFTMNASFAIHDPSGELLDKSAGYLDSIGYQVKVLHFANPAVSCRFNPLARANSSSDIQKIASMLVQSSLGSNSKDPFWNTMAVGLLAMLITILKTQDEQYQNLFNVRQLLNALGGSPKDVDRLFSDHADEVLFNEYKSFLSYDEKVTSGIIATCKAALQIFSDSAVASVTSTDDVDFCEFREVPVALFIQNSVADQKYYSVLTSIFFEQFFSFIMSRFPGKDEQDIFFLIDEASSLCLPTLPLAVANVRKHRSGIMLLLQDFNQLVHSYGKYEADAIRANCFAKLYLTGQSLETSRELEQTLGRFEFLDKDDHKSIRPLMTNDEIRMMPSNRALLVCGHHPPIIAKLKPYYKRKNFREYTSMPVPELENPEMESSLSILPLKEPPLQDVA